MRKVYVETYGCRMNLIDSEIILSIMSEHGYEYTNAYANADCVILNGCSVREIGHIKVFDRVNELADILQPHVILIIAGCISTQLDDSFFETYPRVQLVIHPASYRDIPEAINDIALKQSRHLLIKGDNKAEVYDRQLPLRALEDNVNATVTIMRGCDLYCSYCIEPYTRGERVNRSYDGIMTEIADIRKKGYPEITLFGHIVDLWQGEHCGITKNFAQLLSDVAESCPEQRIKFISSHPLTFTEQIAQVMACHKNIMRVIHLPVQSGSDEILHKMNRKYTARLFCDRVRLIRRILPDINIFTDVMVGFPGEEEIDFVATLNLLSAIRLTNINVFMFSMRKGTLAYSNYIDDVPLSIKEDRRNRVYSLIADIKKDIMCGLVGTKQRIIAESQNGNSGWWAGRDMYHRTIYFTPDSMIKSGEQYEIIVKHINEDKIYGEIHK